MAPHFEQAEANAAFIVKACNSHYELLSRLKEVVAADSYRMAVIASNSTEKLEFADKTFWDAIDAARAAIAKATGEQQ